MSTRVLDSRQQWRATIYQYGISAVVSLGLLGVGGVFLAPSVTLLLWAGVVFTLNLLTFLLCVAYFGWFSYDKWVMGGAIRSAAFMVFSVAVMIFAQQ